MDRTKETIESLLDVIQSTADIIYDIAYTKGGAYKQYANEFSEIDDFLDNTQHDLNISAMSDKLIELDQRNEEKIDE